MNYHRKDAVMLGNEFSLASRVLHAATLVSAIIGPVSAAAWQTNR